MIKTQFCSLLPLLATLAVPTLAADVMDLQVDFQNQATGNYTKSNLNGDFPNATNNASALLGFPDYEGSTNGRTTIEEFGVGPRVLRVKYPQGVVGIGGGGAQFYKPLTPRDEYNFEYRVKFLAGFDFGQAGSSGGKLPGLGGGTQPAGGNYSANGFSTRYMWHPAVANTTGITSKPHLNLYFYYAEQSSRFQTVGSQYGDAIPLAIVTTETYYTLRQRVKLNTPGYPDGILQIWVNGSLVLSRTNVKYRYSTGTFKIDDLFFCTFYGGSKSTDAPRTTTYAAFDDFRVWHPDTATATATTSSDTGS